MLKKVTAIILALSLCNLSLFAQLSEEVDVITEADTDVLSETVSVNLIPQHIKWREVNRARSYEIEVQKKTADGWIESGTWVTEETEFDLMLEAGSYRFRLAAMNAIGKKSAPSGWAEFDVIEESQPYLRAVGKSEWYGVPAIERSIDDENGTETITLRGVHCFDEGSSFRLEPCTDEAKTASFKALEKQTAMTLPVVESDGDSGVVKLSLDWSRIVSGYYTIVVTNGAGLTDSLTVLMLPDRQPVLASRDSVHDDIIQADCLTLDSALSALSFDVSAVQSDSAYQLVPVDDADRLYPFETSYGRAQMTLDGATYNNGILSLGFDASLLKSGWYDIIATTPGAEPGTQRILVRAEEPSSSIPAFKSVSAKYDASRKCITFTVKTEDVFFSETEDFKAKLYLISEKDEYAEYSRSLLRMSSAAKNGKSADFEVMASSVKQGLNALMLETVDGVRIAYISINSGYKTEEVTLSDAEIREHFLRAPTEKELAAREKRLAEKGAGNGQPAYLPAFLDAGKGWGFTERDSFPATMGGDETSLVMSVRNMVPSTPYDVQYRMYDEETINMLREAEGFSFESMVTNRNNGWTKWSLIVETSSDDVEIPLPSDFRQLSQTVILWKEYQIDPATIMTLNFVVTARHPSESGWNNTLEIYEAKTYSDDAPLEELQYRDPLFLTKAGVYAGFFLYEDSSDMKAECSWNSLSEDRLADGGVPSTIRLNVFDYGWLSVNGVYHPAGMGEKPMVGGEIALAIPNNWFKPYVGLGLSYAGEREWDEFFAGAVILKYVDIRCSLLQKYGLYTDMADGQTLDNPLGERRWYDSIWLQAGIEIPLRKKIAINPRTQTEVSEKPVFLSDVSVGFDMNVFQTYGPESEYAAYLPDVNFGVRWLGFKYFALDTTFAARGIPAARIKNVDAFDSRLDLEFILPFTLFKTEFASYYALGGGYWKGLRLPGNHVYVSQTVGFRFAKNVEIKASFATFDDNWEDGLSLAESAPIIGPILFALCSNYISVGVNFRLPVRGNK